MRNLCGIIEEAFDFDGEYEDDFDDVQAEETSDAIAADLEKEAMSAAVAILEKEKPVRGWEYRKIDIESGDMRIYGIYFEGTKFFDMVFKSGKLMEILQHTPVTLLHYVLELGRSIPSYAFVMSVSGRQRKIGQGERTYHMPEKPSYPEKLVAYNKDLAKLEISDYPGIQIGDVAFGSESQLEEFVGWLGLQGFVVADGGVQAKIGERLQYTSRRNSAEQGFQFNLTPSADCETMWCLRDIFDFVWPLAQTSDFDLENAIAAIRNARDPLAFSEKSFMKYSLVGLLVARGYWCPSAWVIRMVDYSVDNGESVAGLGNEALRIVEAFVRADKEGSAFSHMAESQLPFLYAMMQDCAHRIEGKPEIWQKIAEKRLKTKKYLEF